MEAAAIDAPANENAVALRLVLVLDIVDPEVAQDLSEHAEGAVRDAFARQALRIGVLALRQARGALDAQSIQREGERVVGALREALESHLHQTTSGLAQLLGRYFDPESGSLPQRLDRLTTKDGELEAVLAKYVDGDRSALAQALARQIGQESALFKLLSPDRADGLIATLSRAVEASLRIQRDEILRQFSRDSPDSALSRLIADVANANGVLRGGLAGDIAKVTEALSLENDQGALSRFVARIERTQRTVIDQLSLDCEGSAIRRLSSALDETRATVSRSLTLDDPASPLSRLRHELMTAVAAFTDSSSRFQSDVRATLETFQARRREAARGSQHGHTFEYAAGDLLQDEARRAGDVCERLAGTPGRENRKTGDYVITMGPETAAPGARIVIECKADKGYSETRALEEMALARKNREAQVGIFVLARESAWGTEVAALRRVGQDILVVWDSEDSASDVYLLGAISVARALAVRDHTEFGRTASELQMLEEGARVIERLVTAIDAIARDAQSVIRRGTRIAKAAGTVRERLEGEVDRLRGLVQRTEGLRHDEVERV